MDRCKGRRTTFVRLGFRRPILLPALVSEATLTFFRSSTVRYAPEKIPYGIERYQNETKRLYGVMEDHLTGKKDGEPKEYFVGGRYSVADMMSHGWIRMAAWAGVDIKPFPALEAWVARVEARPATKEALKVPEQDMLTRVSSFRFA